VLGTNQLRNKDTCQVQVAQPLIIVATDIGFMVFEYEWNLVTTPDLLPHLILDARNQFGDGHKQELPVLLDAAIGSGWWDFVA
jgi:hypothetical protein